MTSGQTALSLSEIPFVYSLVNIVFIWLYGLEDLNRFIVLGLLAGILGTFLVFWHPLQFLYDKLMMSRYEEKLSHYSITNPGKVPDKFDIIIDIALIRLSLKTTSIKYLKNKIVSQDYFIAILTTLLAALTVPSFQKSILLYDNPYLSWIMLAVFGMLGGMFYLTYRQTNEFFFNLKLNAIYFFLTNHIIGFGDASNIIKNAIDLNDWTTVKEMINRQLHIKWTTLGNFSKKE